MTCRFCVCIKVCEFVSVSYSPVVAIEYMIYIYASAETLNASARQKLMESAGPSSAAWKTLASLSRADPGDQDFRGTHANSSRNG